MLTEWLTKKYLDKKSALKLHQKYFAAKPYPHLVLLDFFTAQKAQLLRQALLKEPFERMDKDLFSFNSTKELCSSPNHFIQQFYTFISSPAFMQVMSVITQEKLNRSADMHGHLFSQGDYLLFHDDNVEARSIAYVINLSHGFTDIDGGKLAIYDVKKPQKSARSILPAFNSFVCFKVSPKSLHAVQEVLTNKKRLTIGGWLYGP